MLHKSKRKVHKQRIEEVEATLRELNKQLQSASHEVINVEDPNSATKVSQERNSQKSFISIDTSSPLSVNLQLAQWPLDINSTWYQHLMANLTLGNC